MHPRDPNDKNKNDNDKPASRRRGSSVVSSATDAMRKMSFSGAEDLAKKAVEKTGKAVQAGYAGAKDAGIKAAQHAAPVVKAAAAKTKTAAEIVAAKTKTAAEQAVEHGRPLVKAAGAKVAEGAKTAAAKSEQAARNAMTAAKDAYQKRRRDSSTSAVNTSSQYRPDPSAFSAAEHLLFAGISELVESEFTAEQIQKSIAKINGYIERYNRDRMLFADVKNFIDQFHLKEQVSQTYIYPLNPVEEAMVQSFVGKFDLDNLQVLKQLTLKFVNDRYFRDHPDERVQEEQYQTEEAYDPFAGTKNLYELLEGEEEEQDSLTDMQRQSLDISNTFDRTSNRFSASFAEARYSTNTTALQREQLDRELSDWLTKQEFVDNEGAGLEDWLGSTGAGAQESSVAPSPANKRRSAGPSSSAKSPRNSSSSPKGSGRSSGGKR